MAANNFFELSKRMQALIIALLGIVISTALGFIWPMAGTWGLFLTSCAVVMVWNPDWPEMKGIFSLPERKMTHSYPKVNQRSKRSKKNHKRH
jgi:hypothetical protein